MHKSRYGETVDEHQLKQGLLPVENTYESQYFRTIFEGDNGDECFKLNLVHEKKILGIWGSKLKGAAFYITTGRIDRRYAVVDFNKEGCWSINIDLPPRLLDKVLYHFEASFQDPDDSPNEGNYTPLYKELIVYADKKIREKFGVPRPESPKYQSKSNVIPFRKK
jgi:hypothetical protein